MAMITCHECGKEVSDTADACPSCGARPKKETGHGWKVFLAVGGFVVLMLVINHYGTRQTQPALTPQEQAAKERQDIRLQKTVLVARGIKRSLRNPESVKWETFLANDDASVVCIQYRAQNMFGGMSREIVVVTPSGTSQSPEDWNKRCTGALMSNLSHAAYAI